MTELQFQASAERLADDTRLIRVSGELDLYTAPEFDRELDVNGGPHGRVVVDLSECSFIDSTALGILVDADRHLGSDALLIVASGLAVLRAFEVSGLDRRLTLHPSLSSALNGHSSERLA